MKAAFWRAARRMKRAGPWLVAAAALAIGLLLAIPVLANPDFYVALVATYIGAALGFFVALTVDRLQRREDEKSRRAAATDAAKAAQDREADAARVRRTAVLSLLRAELGRVVGQMATSFRQSRSYPPPDRMTDILWRAFSSSGELRWIENLDLLREVASAYDLLSVEIELERRWFEARERMGGTKGSSEDYIANRLRGIDRDLWNGACRACKAMDAALVADGAEPGGEVFCP
jgi:hypothetical protein